MYWRIEDFSKHWALENNKVLEPTRIQVEVTNGKRMPVFNRDILQLSRPVLQKIREIVVVNLTTLYISY